jgi:hypothetical protein
MTAPSVEIPPEPTLRRSCGPPERILLPITAASRLGFFGWLFFTAIASVGALGLAGGAILLIVVIGDRPHVPSVQDFIFAVIGFACAGFGWCLLGCAVTLIADRLRRQPVLTIDTDRIKDTRLLAVPTPWSAVVKASLVWRAPYTREDPVAVRLVLRTTVRVRHNPFRHGALGFCWRPRPNELYVPLYFLTQRRHVLAHAIAALVRDAGGMVEPEEMRGYWRRFALVGLSGSVAAYALIHLGLVILLALPVVIVGSKLLAPVARRRGWFGEGRLTRYVTRPRFDDETHRNSAH